MRRRVAGIVAGVIIAVAGWMLVSPRVGPIGTPSDWALGRAVARELDMESLPCFRHERRDYCPAASDRFSGWAAMYRVRIAGSCFTGVAVHGHELDDALPRRIDGCVRLNDQRPRFLQEILFRWDDPKPPYALSRRGPAAAG